ncbi:virulence-associated E family protein [Peribacillus frigoritolerans]|uniref:VapE domain-containing protein n=1 Tax=Peribacillus frigoritolerans TaxID=450367 RepID=UPI00345CA578
MSNWTAAIEKHKEEVPYLLQSNRDRQLEVLEDWKERLQVSERGKIYSNPFNVLLILQNDENLKGRFAFNLLTKMPEISGQVLWKRINNSAVLTDHDDSCLRNYLSINYDIKAKDIVYDSLNQIVLENQYHPVRDYLSSLPKWDGKPRLDTLLIDYFDAEDTKLNRAQTRQTFIGAIKRAFQPGCKFDYVLTLKGPQGVGKSTFLEAISVRKEWFSDSMDDIRGKDAKEQLSGNWIIELGEMAAVGSGDQKRIKQFITSTEDEFRPAYGRRTIRVPRQNIFVATTNDDLPLKDDTGGRRWWIVEVKSKWFEKDIPLEVDQIWAEAVSVYKYMESNKIPLKLENDLEAEAKKIQNENTDKGIYATEIEYVLSRGYIEKDDFHQGKIRIPITETCAFHVWEEILGRYRQDLTKVTAREINATLKNMPGWICRGRVQFGEYGKQTVYKRGDI